MPVTVGVVGTGPDGMKMEEGKGECTEEEQSKEENGREEESKEDDSKVEDTKVDGSRVKKEKKKPSFKEKVKKITINATRRLSEINGAEASTTRQNGENNPESPAAASPALSIRSSGTSPGGPLSPSSPSDSLNADSPFQIQKHDLSRRLSDPIPTGINTGDTRSSFIRRSLRLSKRKDKEPKPDFQTVSDSIKEESTENIHVQQSQELSESYELPEIPENPLSIMQINTLIGNMQLEDAHLNLLSLRLELQKELEEKGMEDSPIELAKKEKDLNLLYSSLKEKMQIIVRDSNNQPSYSDELLVHVVRIIQEEKKRKEDPGRAGWDWTDTWKEAVQEGVQAKIKSVPLESKEQNSSWLAVHLGHLGKTVLEDLENVKNQLKSSYPPSFDVFNTYVDSYRQSIGNHLKNISQKELETKDCYALLDWIVNCYKSEKMMSSPTLQPDMNLDNIPLPVEDSFMDQIKGSFCRLIKDDIKEILSNIIKLQTEEAWNGETEPELEEGFYHSEVHMDIGTTVKSYCKNSKKIDDDLKTKVVCTCLEELQPFLHRFEEEFSKWCETLSDTSVGDKYRIAYINSFMALKGHLEEYRVSSPQQVEHLEKKMDDMVNGFSQTLISRFQMEVKPFLKRMMTRKWLSTDADFKHIVKRTEDLLQLSSKMEPPRAKTFGSEVHYFVVKEYISQLMTNNYSCKNRKNEMAAQKINKEWGELEDIFTEQVSDATWLHPLGEHLCYIIGNKNKKEIKNILQPLVQDYPDISQKHLAALLYFRGIVQGRERQLILRRLMELKKTMRDPGTRDQALFSNIQVTDRDCLANMPFFCLGRC